METQKTLICHGFSRSQTIRYSGVALLPPHCYQAIASCHESPVLAKSKLANSGLTTSDLSSCQRTLVSTVRYALASIRPSGRHALS